MKKPLIAIKGDTVTIKMNGSCLVRKLSDFKGNTKIEILEEIMEVIPNE